MTPLNFSKLGKCKKCGDTLYNLPFLDDEYKNIMLEERLCYECYYWTYVVPTIPHTQIIGRSLWSFPPTADQRRHLKRILTFDGEIIESTEFYNYGAIPLRFWEQYPETASYLGRGDYSKIVNNPNFICGKKGCYDRMQCFFYQNNPEKDWNKIPENWRVGMEKCPLFINVKNPRF